MRWKEIIALMLSGSMVVTCSMVSFPVRAQERCSIRDSENHCIQEV